MELIPDYNEQLNVSVYYHNDKPAYTIDWNQSSFIRNYKSYPLFKVDNGVQKFEKWLTLDEIEEAYEIVLAAKYPRVNQPPLPPLEHDANPLSISPIGIQPNEFVPIQKEMVNVGKISPLLNPMGKLNEVQTELNGNDEKDWEKMIAKVPNTFKKKKKVRFKGRYECKDCGKNYSGASGLWYHKKKTHKKGGRKSRKKRRHGGNNKKIIERVDNGEIRQLNGYPGWYFDFKMMTKPPYNTKYYQIKRTTKEVLNDGTNVHPKKQGFKRGWKSIKRKIGRLSKKKKSGRRKKKKKTRRRRRE